VIPCPPQRLWNRSITLRPDTGSRLAAGSSAISSRGRRTSARAMATRCCCPPESASARIIALSARLTASSASSARWRHGSGAMLCEKARQLPGAPNSPWMTFDRTVRRRTRQCFWNTKPVC